MKLITMMKFSREQLCGISDALDYYLQSDSARALAVQYALTLKTAKVRIDTMIELRDRLGTWTMEKS